jgi:hypothetical protein
MSSSSRSCARSAARPRSYRCRRACRGSSPPAWTGWSRPRSRCCRTRPWLGRCSGPAASRARRARTRTRGRPGRGRPRRACASRAPRRRRPRCRPQRSHGRRGLLRGGPAAARARLLPLGRRHRLLQPRPGPTRGIRLTASSSNAVTRWIAPPSKQGVGGAPASETGDRAEPGDRGRGRDRDTQLASVSRDTPSRVSPWRCAAWSRARWWLPTDVAG